jgi:hypothetical protein
LNFTDVDLDQKLGAFFVFAGVNLSYVFLSGLVVLVCGVSCHLCCYLFEQPQAGGAGIAEVKGYLNGVVVAGTIRYNDITVVD